MVTHIKAARTPRSNVGIMRRRSSTASRIPARLNETLRSLIANQLADGSLEQHIYNYLSDREVCWMPQQLGKWPLDACTLAELILRVEQGLVDAVIEFGSGASTVAIAKALRHANAHEHAAGVLHLAFEHHPQFHRQTLSALHAMELGDIVRLELAQLAPSPHRHPMAEAQEFYACSSAIEHFLAGLPEGARNLLVLVDGPPGSTCRYARYPALPHVLHPARHLETTFVLDDSRRPDECAALEQWQRLMKDQGVAYSTRAWKSDKGVVEIQVPAAVV